jgi:methylisocitrate lyase
MLYATRSPAEKRAELRERLRAGTLLQFPGAFNPLSAKLIERHGFDGVYVSGAVLSADLGLPDIGLTTLSEVAARSRQIARVTELPVLADADTGFGEPMNVARTVQELEDAGLAALHIEDQVNPKRCGHLEGKQVVDEETAAQRIRADGLAATTDRAKRLVDAGADAIFPEALESLEEFAALRSAIEVPMMANMTEFGKSELFTTDQLRDVGVDIVIWPVSLLRMAMGAAERALETLATQGSLTSALGQMQHRRDLYDLVDYEGYNRFDESIFNFRVGD